MGLFRCVHFLAWPVVALGYPLFASIIAVETGSEYHMRKLIVYWTLFALISLFEFAFTKMIQWIPFWSSIRLVAIFWLVLPQFDGACHAYENIVRLVLTVNQQGVIDKVFRLKEKRETFMDVAAKNIEENGSRVSENLTASTQECSDSLSEIQVSEAKEKNVSWASILLKKPDASQQDNEKLEIPPLKKATQQEWSCDLCKVKATSEHDLKAHLKGFIHKSNCRSLKAIKHLSGKPDRQGKAKANKDGAAKQTFNRHCNVCDVKMPTDAQLTSHLKGKRHLDNIRKMANHDGVVSSS